MKSALLVSAAFGLSLTLACGGAERTPVNNGNGHAGPPVAAKRPVTDTFHGVSVSEDYRWLEDWTADEVQAWSNAQDSYARSSLAKLPNREAIEKRVREVYLHQAEKHWDLTPVGNRIFAMKYEPPKQQPFLVVMPSIEEPDKATTIVDPNTMSDRGAITIDWFVPSPDGKVVAVSLSEGGTESGDVHFYDVSTGKTVHEVLPRVQGGTAGGDLAWTPDGKGVYYTRYPADGERAKEDMSFYQQLWFHQIGTPIAKDRYELGKDFPRVAEIQIDIDRAGRVLVTVQDGDGGEFAHHLKNPKGEWKQFSRFGDRTLQATFGPNFDLFVISRAGAPRGKVVRVNMNDLDVAKGKVIIPQSNDTIVSSFWSSGNFTATARRLYVTYQLGGPAQIRAFNFDGRPVPAPSQLKVSAVGGITSIGGDEILFANGSYTQPRAWYHFDGTRTKKTQLAPTAAIDLSKVSVYREMATSKDGTKVPVNILVPPNVERDGTAPAVLTGYGGYGISLQPYFAGSWGMLLEQGIVVAVANLRGGGEFGEEWHKQGNLTNKQNVFDDFAGVLDHLVARKYTSHQRILVQGGSNGGLLMGATLVQHPAKVKAVVSSVGIYDMLRVELSPNGAFNVTEFGTVKNPDHFKALYAYSPYHNVKDGAAYPPTLFLTGANDPRVDPAQSRKMTARLQAAGGNVLLRTSHTSGHGGSKSMDERIAEAVDVGAYIYHQLGVTYGN